MTTTPRPGTAEGLLRRVVPAVVAALVVPALAGCDLGSPADPSPAAGTDSTAFPSREVMYDVEHYMTTNGVRQAFVEADTAYLDPDSSFIEMRSVRMDVYTEEGRLRAEVTSEDGELDPATERLVARGDVLVEIAGTGRTIETEELHYDPRSDRMWSDVPTVMREEGRVVRGTGFESDGRFEHVTIENARTEGGVGS